MKPTWEQVQAIETQGRPLVVEAGAGTGKTWVLVERFIYLLDEHPDWPLDSILAVTFTEKATREMRSRIRRAVEARAAAAPGDSHWVKRRRELENLQVSTIHGLCARILRENAIAAGIDPRFQVLEEQDADLLKEEAIQQTIRVLADEDSPTLDLLVSINVRDLRDEMSSLLARRGTVSHLFARLPDEETLLQRWSEKVAEMREQQWQEQLRQEPGFREAMEGLGNLPIRDPDDKLTPAVEYAKQGIKLANEGDKTGAVEEWLNINLMGGKRDNWGGAETLEEIKDQLKVLRTTAQGLEKSGFIERFGERDESAARALQLWKQLWVRLNEIYDRIKDEQQVLDFDDLELRTAHLLETEPHDERLKAFLEGINHLMVDEFQDTNAVQRDIIYRLAHPRDDGRLFVVGDAKQSIYRFRQAQVAVFNRTIQDILSLTGHDPLPLSRSFRTHSLLVEALNDLFNHILQPQDGEPAEFEAHPGPLSAQRESPMAPQSAPAPVELIVLSRKDEQGESIRAEEGRILEAQVLARRLLELESEGFPVWDKKSGEYRPMRFGDAAILFRATTSLPLYEEEFKRAGVPYLTVSGRGYYDRPEVQDLIALLTCLYSPGDDLNLAAALRSPLFNLSDESLYRLRRHAASPPVRYASALRSPPPTDQDERIQFAAQVLEELWHLTGRVAVWRLLRVALDRTGFEAALLGQGMDQDGGIRQLGNVSKFLELAREWGGTSLSDFLRRLQDLRAREAREGEAIGSAPESGAVQLMSIHAAKGLEFPVVVVADLGRSRRGGFGSPRILHDPSYGLVCKQRDMYGDWQHPVSYRWGEWMDEKMEVAEDRRLLYVACTRAADLLILSGKPGRMNSWLSDILEAWDLEEQGPEEEILSRGDFSLRVLRPGGELQEAVEQPRHFERSPGITEMPAMAIPIGNLLPAQASAAKDLRERGQPLPELRPLSRDYGPHTRGPYISAGTVGAIVHRALANWDCLSLPQRELEAHIGAYARQQGVTSQAGVEYTVGQAVRMVDNLRRSDLYAQINAARQRLSEVPFNLSAPKGELYGVIDLLFEEEGGGWHMIDWKTEWVEEGDLERHVEKHAPQMEQYTKAVQEVLGVQVRARLCFLRPRLRLATL